MCPKLTLPDNGAVVPSSCSQTDVEYGTRCVVYCGDGYALSGPRYTTCQNDTSWSLPAPWSCVRGKKYSRAVHADQSFTVRTNIVLYYSLILYVQTNHLLYVLTLYCTIHWYCTCRPWTIIYVWHLKNMNQFIFSNSYWLRFITWRDSVYARLRKYQDG